MIKYQDLIERAFIRENANDPVWYREHGFQYFILHRQFGKHFGMEYEIFDQTVKVHKTDPYEGDILDTVVVDNLEELDRWIKILGKAIDKHKKLCRAMQRNISKAWEKEKKNNQKEENPYRHVSMTDSDYDINETKEYFLDDEKPWILDDFTPYR